MKSSLKVKITLWFIIIIIVAFILYGSLIFTVFRFNLREEKFIHSLKDNPEIGRVIIDRITEINRREKEFRFFPPLTILSSGLLWRVLSIISGGVLLIIIVSTSGGFLFLRRSLNQINTITNNVKEIDEKKLHLRLNLKGNDAISKMAKTFDSMLNKIENSFNQQKQFIQNASHELNTPLTIIKTKIDVLKLNKNITKKEYEETLQLINSEIVRLSKITDNLLLLSSLEDISKQNQFEQVDIKKIIQKVLTLFRNKIEAKNLIPKTSYKGHTNILGIKTQVEQFVFNLIDNAIKYSEQNKELEIKTYTDSKKSNLFFEIKNESSFIKKEDIPHIFDRFYKVKGASSCRIKGYGLGLSICKKIIENHKGKITLQLDKQNRVVTFKVTLPLFEAKTNTDKNINRQIK